MSAHPAPVCPARNQFVQKWIAAHTFWQEPVEGHISNVSLHGLLLLAHAVLLFVYAGFTLEQRAASEAATYSSQLASNFDPVPLTITVDCTSCQNHVFHAYSSGRCASGGETTIHDAPSSAVMLCDNVPHAGGVTAWLENMSVGSRATVLVEGAGLQTRVPLEASMERTLLLRLVVRRGGQGCTWQAHCNLDRELHLVSSQYDGHVMGGVGLGGARLNIQLLSSVDVYTTASGRSLPDLLAAVGGASFFLIGVLGMALRTILSLQQTPRRGSEFGCDNLSEPLELRSTSSCRFHAGSCDSRLGRVDPAASSSSCTKDIHVDQRMSHQRAALEDIDAEVTNRMPSRLLHVMSRNELHASSETGDCHFTTLVTPESACADIVVEFPHDEDKSKEVGDEHGELKARLRRSEREVQVAIDELREELQHQSEACANVHAQLQRTELDRQKAEEEREQQQMIWDTQRHRFEELNRLVQNERVRFEATQREVTAESDMWRCIPKQSHRGELWEAEELKDRNTGEALNGREQSREVVEVGSKVRGPQLFDCEVTSRRGLAEEEDMEEVCSMRVATLARVEKVNDPVGQSPEARLAPAVDLLWRWDSPTDAPSVKTLLLDFNQPLMDGFRARFAGEVVLVDSRVDAPLNLFLGRLQAVFATASPSLDDLARIRVVLKAIFWELGGWLDTGDAAAAERHWREKVQPEATSAAPLEQTERDNDSWTAFCEQWESAAITDPLPEEIEVHIGQCFGQESSSKGLGRCHHRAILMKYVCDAFAIAPCALWSATPQRFAWNVVKIGRETIRIDPIASPASPTWELATLGNEKSGDRLEDTITPLARNFEARDVPMDYCCMTRDKPRIPTGLMLKRPSPSSRVSL